ncbi:hypothetical protein [Frankia sp. R82]|uniref:hypothetical protein n=1 Tax=Frankia sp. R82 TaxID=2950553 RepID=UPI00204498F6|nr:hypothetical protein [Frankia sp. R82]MCM3885527.1 hypothetical protein [Frankia sp. R82]
MGRGPRDDGDLDTAFGDARPAGIADDAPLVDLERHYGARLGVFACGRLAARVVDIGRRPRARTMDLLIAATAHAHGASVYTRSAAGLAGLEDLITIVTI